MKDKEFCQWVLSSVEHNPNCSPCTKHLAKYVVEMERFIPVDAPEVDSETSSLASGWGWNWAERLTIAA